MNEVEAVFTPSRVMSKSSMKILIFGQLLVFVAYWAFLTPAVIPKPMEVLGSLRDLFAGGLIADLYTSVMLYLEAVALATVISLAIAYASVLPFFQPFAALCSDLRFIGLAGLPFLFTMYLSGAHTLKLALLVFAISVFTVTGMLDVVASIPKDKYDLARTLRMNEWHVMWEVVVLGRFDVALDVIRQNSAMGFMMLTTVEALFRSEGGIGASLATQDKHFGLAAIVGIQMTILVIGLFLDYLFGVVKAITCPYARLLLEKR